MSASPASGDRPPLPGMRRSFTTPVRQLSIHEKAGLDKTDAEADVLYSHPNARIVSFSPPTDSIKSFDKSNVPADTDYPVDTIETLPWRSRTETLAASGVMIIEKVRGSTNFLKCQDVMHAILRNSQCWCVDGESKFVLRIGKLRYYRIELPSAMDENKAKVEELKRVLPTVLRFERTPCPFIRAFTVDLPDDAITPRRKGRWQRRDSAQLTNSDTETPPLRRSKPTRSWSMKSPPTSYPKHGPGRTSVFERGRPSSSAGSLRQESFFDNLRNSSPASYVPSDDGTDSEQQESEHSSERESITDGSETTSPHHNLRDTQSSELPQTDRPVRGKDFQSIPSGSVSGIVSQITQAETQNTTTKDSRKSASKPESTRSVAREDLSAAESRHEVNGKRQIEQLEVANEVPLVAETEMKTMAAVPQYHETAQRETPVEALQLARALTEDMADEVEVRATTAAAATTTTAMPTADPPLFTDDISASTESLEHSTESSGAESTGNSAESSEAEDEAGQSSDSDSSSDSQSLSTSEATDVNGNSIVVRHTEAESISSEETTSEDSEDTEESEELEQASEPESLGNSRPRSGVETPPENIISPEEVDEHSTPLTASISEDRIPTVLPSAIPVSSRDDGDDEENSEEEEEDDDDDDDDDDNSSNVSSVDSFHTMASTLHRDSMNENITDARNLLPAFPGRRQHKREISELTVTASEISDSALPNHGLDSQQLLVEDQAPVTIKSSVPTQSQLNISRSAFQNEDLDGLRQRLKARRSFSPLPPASTIFTGSQIRHDSGGGHMTKAILQKVIVKPIEVVFLLVHILARIAGGATMNDLLSGELFRTPEHPRSVSGFTDQLNEINGNGSDTDDDYGVPIRGRRHSNPRNVVGAFDGGGNDVLEDVD